MNRLKELRKEKKLTLDDVSKAVGISNPTLSRYEKGTRNPKIENWQKLADFFEVSVGYIQGKEDDESEKWVRNHLLNVIITFIKMRGQQALREGEIDGLSANKAYKAGLENSLQMIALIKKIDDLSSFDSINKKDGKELSRLLSQAGKLSDGIYSKGYLDDLETFNLDKLLND